MISKPTEAQRNVVLAPQFAKGPSHQTGSGETLRVVRICVLFHDHERISQEHFEGVDETTLLSGFWKALRAGDRIFVSDVEMTLSLLRRRSWAIRVFPSRDIHLRCIYDHQVIDTKTMSTRRAICRSGHMERQVPVPRRMSRMLPSAMTTAPLETCADRALKCK